MVVNHHLLCADFAIKDDGFGELLPGADAFIIDEAHQLPEVASNFFGTTVSTRQLLELTRDTQTEYHREAGDLPKLLEQLDVVARSARDLRLAFGQALRRGSWAEVEAEGAALEALDVCRGQLRRLKVMLESIQGRGKGLDSCLARCETLASQLQMLISPEEGNEDIRWFETYMQSLRLNSTPLDVAEVFGCRCSATRRPGYSPPRPWPSATASNISNTSSACSMPARRSGTARSTIRTRRCGSCRATCRSPATPAIRRRWSTWRCRSCEASGGRAFLLFTSHRALRQAADLLEDQVDVSAAGAGQCAQGRAARERFVEHGNAVLLGTASFWEGVDVRGDALSLVVIDKLPFASPGDPVLQARLDAIRRRGGNPFMQHQVPQAAIALKQGAGRLIRDVSDRGVLVMCDPRLLKKGYGQTFLDAMPRVRAHPRARSGAGLFRLDSCGHRHDRRTGGPGMLTGISVST